MYCQHPIIDTTTIVGWIHTDPSLEQNDLSRGSTCGGGCFQQSRLSGQSGAIMIEAWEPPFFLSNSCIKQINKKKEKIIENVGFSFHKLWFIHSFYFFLSTNLRNPITSCAYITMFGALGMLIVRIITSIAIIWMTTMTIFSSFDLA